MPGSGFFGEALRLAVEGGEVEEARLDDMVLRILWALFSVGVMGHPQDVQRTQRRLAMRPGMDQRQAGLDQPATR